MWAVPDMPHKKNMPVNQLEAEVTLTFKRKLPANLRRTMETHFKGPGDDIEECSRQTSLSGLANTLSHVVYAKDRDTTAYLYLEEDINALRVHIALREPSTLATIEHEIKSLQEILTKEIDSLGRFAKSNGSKLGEVRIQILCDKVRMLSATRRGFLVRLSDGVKSNLPAKLAIPIATALASTIFQTDAANAFKAFVTGLIAVVVGTLVEAATAESLKYVRS
jgi:hypothetical protein